MRIAMIVSILLLTVGCSNIDWYGVRSGRMIGLSKDGGVCTGFTGSLYPLQNSGQDIFYFTTFSEIDAKILESSITYGFPVEVKYSHKPFSGICITGSGNVLTSVKVIEKTY